MGQVLYKCMDGAVTEDATTILFTKRPRGILAITGIAFVAGLVFWALGGLLGSSESLNAAGLFLIDCGKLILFIGSFGLAAALLILFVPKLHYPWAIDIGARTLRVGSDIMPLGSLTAFQAQPHMGFVRLSAIPRAGEGKVLLTVAEKDAATIEELTRKLNALVGAGAEKADTSAITVSQEFGFNVPAVIVLFIGFVWLVGGLLFFSGLRIVSVFGDGSGIPVWMIGVIGLGIGAWLLWKGRKKQG